MPGSSSLQELLNAFESFDEDFLFTAILRELDSLMKTPTALNPDEVEASAHEWIAACLDPDIDRMDGSNAQGLPSNPGLLVADGTCELRERDCVWTISFSSIEYWRNRARSTQNPDLSARYAHLAWAFARPVKVKPSIDDARLARSRYLSVVGSADEERSVVAVEALRRAAIFTIGLPGAMGANEHREVLEAYIDLATRLPEPQCPLVRHLIMDDLVLGRFSGKFQLTEAHEELALSQVRKEFDRDQPASWVENARRMIRYYSARERTTDAQSIARELVERLKVGCETGDSWLHQHWARRALPLLQPLGLAAEEEVLHRAIEQAGPGVLAQLRAIESSAPLPAGVVEQFRRRAGAVSLDELLSCLRDAIPHETEIQRALESQSKSVFLQLGVRISLTTDGVPAEMKSGPMSEQESLRRAWRTAVENMSHLAQLLWRVCMDAHRPGPDELLAAMSAQAWMPPGHEVIFHRACEALVAGDDLVFLHLVVPQFEPLIRHLASNRGQSTYHVPPTQQTSLETDNLSYLLGSDVALAAFGEEGVQFLRTLLVEDPGFNLRNRLAHGLLKSEEFSRQLTVSCIQALLIIARANGS